MAVEFIRYLDKSIKYLHRQGCFSYSEKRGRSQCKHNQLGKHRF